MSNDLTTRLAAANPVSRQRLADLPASAATALALEITMTDLIPASDLTSSAPPTPMPTQPTRPAQPRRRRRVALAAFAVAALAIGVPAAAIGGVPSALHTGIFGQPGDTEARPGEEFLDAADPEIVTVVREIAAGVPLPAGASYDELYRRYPLRERVILQRSVLGLEVEIYAQCRWYQGWLAGDAATHTAMQPTLDAIPGWRYTSQPNAAPKAGGPAVRSPEALAPTASSGDSVSATPMKDLAARIAEQARSGDGTLMRQFVAANC